MTENSVYYWCGLLKYFYGSPISHLFDVASHRCDMVRSPLVENNASFEKQLLENCISAIFQEESFFGTCLKIIKLQIKKITNKETNNSKSWDVDIGGKYVNPIPQFGQNVYQKNNWAKPNLGKF